MSQIKCVFIDESGDTSIEIEKSGVSRWYVLVAIIVNSEQIRHVEKILQLISKERFGGTEIKSSNVGGNTVRRKKILTDMSNIDFQYYAYIVDKQKIYKDSGLQYKQSFYKYLNGNLYERLFKPITNIQIYADHHGRSDFMSSFQTYFKKRFKLPLLESEIFHYSDSKENSLIQLADFIAGTIARHLNGKDSSDLVQQIASKKLFTYMWPPTISKSEELDKLDHSAKYNQIIREQSVRLAKEFIYKYVDSPVSETQTKVKTLEYLLYRFFTNPEDYVFSEEILEHLSKVGLEDITKHVLRSGIIAPLRDTGVVIASCNKGYKIPNKSSDMRQFVKTVDGVVIPYIQRLNSAREIMLVASNGEYDIVSSEEFPKLRSYLNESEYL